jgi:radical SAM superfamily enzyme YgiQ (UPF0313 family)
MGIESFTPSTGRYIGKMTDGKRLIEILQMCRESWKDNVIISSTFIAGLPTETYDSLRETFNTLTSKESYYLLDTFRFNKFHVTPGFDDKNDINRARNHPFKDYVLVPGTAYGTDWTSPWANSDEIGKMVDEFNDMKYRKTTITSQNLAQIVNLGYEPEEVVAMGRSGLNRFHFDYDRKTEVLIKDYRARVMADLKVLTTVA